MEWLLKKAIDSAGQNHSPQQVAEILNSHAEAINNLSATNRFTFCFLGTMAIGLVVLNLFIYNRLSRRLKKLEK